MIDETSTPRTGLQQIKYHYSRRPLLFILGIAIILSIGTVKSFASSTTNSIVESPLTGGVTDSQASVIVRTMTPATVNVSCNPGNVAVSGPTIAANDNGVNLKLTNLVAETIYNCSATVPGATAAKAFHFRTFPPAGSQRDFKFAAITDEEILNDAPAFKKASLENPAFVVQLGDFNHDRAGDAKAPTIKNWWTNERNALTGSKTGKLFDTNIAPNFPFVHIWDDHDYGLGNGDKTWIYRSTAIKAFTDYFPTYDVPANGAGLWQTFRYAQSQVFVLDNRSQRDPDSAPDSSTKSMLGTDQRTWLLDGLKNSTATWKFIISPSIWNPTGKRDDSWVLYANEQRTITNYIRDNNIKGVVFMSGDIHSGGGIDNGTNSFFPEMTVPSTNMTTKNCTGLNGCGKWSQGIVKNASPGGYGLFDVKGNTLTLYSKGYDGSIRQKLILTY